MVEAPSSPGVAPRVVAVSNTLKMISGALEPKAIRVKFAKVGFHTATFLATNTSSYSGSFTSITLVCEVITSIALQIITRLVGGIQVEKGLRLMFERLTP